jgi:hypothetical protein
MLLIYGNPFKKKLHSGIFREITERPLEAQTRNVNFLEKGLTDSD